MMDVMKKFIAALTFAIVFLATSASAEPVLQSAPWSGPLYLWVMDNGIGSQKAVHKLVKKFKRDTGISVEVRVLNWGNAYTVITEAFASPDSVVDFPDVLQLGSTWVPHFASVGKLRVLDTLLAQIDSSRFYTEAFKASHIAGKADVYSLPWFLDVRALFANEWLWHTLDIQDSDINSMSKFLGSLRAINRGELKNSEMKRVAAFALPGKDDWTGPQQMAPFVWEFGGDFLKCENGACKSNLLDSATLAGVAVYVKILGDEELAPQSLFENSAQNAVRFVNSELLIHYGTSELVRQLEYPEDVGGLRSSAIADDGIMILPAPEGPHSHSTFVGGSHLALSAHDDSVRFRAAETLLAYMLRADNIDAFSRQVGFLPADRSILHIWNRDSRYSKLVAGLEYCRSFPNIPKWGEVENILIELSNGIGNALAKTGDLEQRSEYLAKLVYNANEKINGVLNHSGNLEEAELLPWIQQFFMNKYKVIYPRNSTEFVSRDELASVDEFGFSSKLLIVAGAGFLVVCIFVIFGFARKRKK